MATPGLARADWCAGKWASGCEAEGVGNPKSNGWGLSLRHILTVLMPIGDRFFLDGWIAGEGRLAGLLAWVLGI